VIPSALSGNYTTGELVERRALACVNVIPVPYPFSYNGARFDVGEYVPIQYYFAAIGITEASVCSYWFSSALDRFISHTFAGGNLTQDIDMQASLIASAIRDHYRQTYMIDPYCMRRIRKWSTNKVAILDNYSHYSSPSPLWADFCIVPKTRHPYWAQSMHLWDAEAYNYIVNTQDPTRKKGTAGTIVMVNEQLGVFRVSYPSLIDQVVDEIIPSGVENIPKGLVGGTGQAVWEQASLSPYFTLETLASVMWDVDSADEFGGSGKFYDVEFDYSSQAGNGPDIVYLSHLDVARYQANREYGEVPFTLNGPTDQPVNSGI
jgi:hypothetical protein